LRSGLYVEVYQSVSVSQGSLADLSTSEVNIRWLRPTGRDQTQIRVSRTEGVGGCQGGVMWLLGWMCTISDA